MKARLKLACLENAQVCGAGGRLAISMTASLGVAMYPDEGRDVESRVGNAEDAPCRTIHGAAPGLVAKWDCTGVATRAAPEQTKEGAEQ